MTTLQRLLFCFLCIFVGDSLALKAHAVDTEAAVTAILEGATVLDVRSAEEFAVGHVKGAKLIPHNELITRRTELGGDINHTIVVYCGSGARAEKAKTELANLGFTNVINGGGLQDLSEKLWEARHARGEN